MKAKTLTAVALAALIGGASFGLVAEHALAQTPMPMDADPLDDRSRKRLDRMEKVVRELRAIVFQGRDTGQPVVVQFSGTDMQLQSLSRRVNDLEATLTRLNAQNETLAHELDLARRALETSREDVDRLTGRIASMESAEAADVMAAEDEADRADEDPDDAFARGEALIDNGDFDAAEAALAGFAQRHPDHPRAAEASYLLGLAYSVRSAHTEAAAAFIGAARNYPDTSWAPDALAELSRSLVALERPDDACATLETLADRYPDAPPAVTRKAASIGGQAECAG